MSPEDQFVFAASCGDTSRILHLSNQGVSANSRFYSTGSSALCRAARHGRYDVCRLLVRLGARPDDQRSGNDMALHCASRGGYTEIVSFLLSVGARVNGVCDGQTAPHVAAKWGRRRVLERLWEHGADFEMENSEGRNVAEEALHWSEDRTYSWVRNKMKNPRSLQLCCKLVILKHYDLSGIYLLPLPQELKYYLNGFEKTLRAYNS